MARLGQQRRQLAGAAVSAQIRARLGARSCRGERVEDGELHRGLGGDREVDGEGLATEDSGRRTGAPGTARRRRALASRNWGTASRRSCEQADAVREVGEGSPAENRVEERLTAAGFGVKKCGGVALRGRGRWRLGSSTRARGTASPRPCEHDDGGQKVGGSAETVNLGGDTTNRTAVRRRVASSTKHGGAIGAAESQKGPRRGSGSGFIEPRRGVLRGRGDSAERLESSSMHG